MLLKEAPEGTSTHYLEEFNQDDVADTVNYLHAKHSDIIQATEIDYSGRADITFNK
ncbi:hypothetical protein [Enterococcus faecium]|uniref:hypothetical protein n=1 Tax=Enterococcus faecium TaxID=1352 RepID=UPI001F286F76|nr:hypothetical protein [Enterococcus faecium]